MKKYPRIPHVPGSNAMDDDVSVDYPRGIFLVFEKVDGANLGISLSGGMFSFQNRGGFLENKRPHPQWDAAKNWFNQHYWGIMNYLAQHPGHTVFGEWLYARHSIYYDSLPSYFFLYDVFDGEKFLQYRDFRKEFIYSAGVFVPKYITITSDIREFVEWSKLHYSSQYSTDANSYEGFIFRDVADYSRAFKYVRSEFTAGIEEHWFNRKLERNSLIRNS